MGGGGEYGPFTLLKNKGERDKDMQDRNAQLFLQLKNPQMLKDGLLRKIFTHLTY